MYIMKKYSKGSIGIDNGKITVVNKIADSVNSLASVYSSWFY